MAVLLAYQLVPVTRCRGSSSGASAGNVPGRTGRRHERSDIKDPEGFYPRGQWPFYTIQCAGISPDAQVHPGQRRAGKPEGDTPVNDASAIHSRSISQCSSLSRVEQIIEASSERPPRLRHVRQSLLASRFKFTYLPWNSGIYRTRAYYIGEIKLHPPRWTKLQVPRCCKIYNAHRFYVYKRRLAVLFGESMCLPYR